MMPVNVLIDPTNDFSKIYSLSYFDTPSGKDYTRSNITMKRVGSEIICSNMRKRDYLNPCKVIGCIQFTHWIEQSRNIDTDTFFMSAVEARDFLAGGASFLHKMRAFDSGEDTDGGCTSKQKTHWKDFSIDYIGKMQKEHVFMLSDHFEINDSLRTQTSINPEFKIQDNSVSLELNEDTDSGGDVDELRHTLRSFKMTPLGDLSEMPLALKYKEDGTPIFYIKHGWHKIEPSYKRDCRVFADYIDSLVSIPIKHNKLTPHQALDLIGFWTSIERSMIKFT